MKVLITGANGFLGSHIVEKALQNGFDTVAAVRKNSNLSHLDTLQGHTPLYIDYGDKKGIVKLLQEYGPFDLVIHNAGLTKSFSLERYVEVNVGLTKNLMDAIETSGCLKSDGKLLYISSMAALGPVGPGKPVSLYGISKLKAERVIRESGIHYLIFRPTGIYGARDQQFLPLFKTARFGLYPVISSSKQRFTLINARDVATNVFRCAQKVQNRIIHLEDGQVYHHSDLKATLEKLLAKKTINLKIPPGVVQRALIVNDILDKLFNRKLKVTREQYLEISQDWDHDFSIERKMIPLQIDYSLFDGFKDTLEYYRRKKLI